MKELAEITMAKLKGLFTPKDNRLTTIEIDTVVEKIRDMYFELSSKYRMADSLGRAFNDRYLGILDDRAKSIDNFLLLEVEFVTQIYEDAKAKFKKRDELLNKRKSAGSSYTDKLLAQFKMNMEAYPVLDSLPKNAVDDVSRLYGALKILADQHWSELSYYLYGTSLSVKFDPLDKDLYMFVSPVDNKVPHALASYEASLTTKYSPSVTEKVRKAQDAIMQAADWIKELLGVMLLAYKEKEPPENVLLVQEVLEDIVDVFRIKNF